MIIQKQFNLSQLKNVTLTTHISGYSKEIRSDMEIEIVNKILKFSRS